MFVLAYKLMDLRTITCDDCVQAFDTAVKIRNSFGAQGSSRKRTVYLNNQLRELFLTRQCPPPGQRIDCYTEVP